MKIKLILSLGWLVMVVAAAPAQDQSVSGIVTTRYTQADGKATAFVLTEAGKPTLAVSATGADAEALLPRNRITLTGTPGAGPFGAYLQVKAGSVSVADTNQPFRSQPIEAAAFKDASAAQGNYVQLPGVTFVTDKFDNSGVAQVKTADGTMVSVLVGKGAAGHAAPKDTTDIFGVVVKGSGGWELVAARFLAANRKEMTDLATKATCLSCHNPDTKVVGPAYRDVAAKYRNDPNAVSELVAQMQNGGTGKWGAVPMPPLKAVVPADDMQKLADWIMSYRWDALLAE